MLTAAERHTTPRRATTRQAQRTGPRPRSGRFSVGALLYGNRIRTATGWDANEHRTTVHAPSGKLTDILEAMAGAVETPLASCTCTIAQIYNGLQLRIAGERWHIQLDGLIPPPGVTVPIECDSGMNFVSAARVLALVGTRGVWRVAPGQTAEEVSRSMAHTRRVFYTMTLGELKAERAALPLRRRKRRTQLQDAIAALELVAGEAGH